jgi:sensor histidine kinase YesM
LKRWKRVLVLSLAAAVASALLIIALYGLRKPSHILLAFFHPVICANIMGGLIAVSLTRFGRRMYLQPFPWNWTLIAAVILICTATGSLAANLFFLAVGLPPASGFWASFWLVNQFAAVIALIFGLSGFVYEKLRLTLEVTSLELRTKQLDEERSRKRALEAQLASLESHIRPHFLFNTLNTISSLIQDDPKLAESLLGKLAALLRFSLESKQRGLAPLGSELKIVRDYLEIERARFGERLVYQIDVPVNVEAVEVPMFSLQTLVENSVKHAVAARVEGGAIRISGRAGNGVVHIAVSDDGPGFPAEAIRPGHGLDNLQARLAAFFGAEAKLEIESNAAHTTVSFQFPHIQG